MVMKMLHFATASFAVFAIVALWADLPRRLPGREQAMRWLLTIATAAGGALNLYLARPL